MRSLFRECANGSTELRLIWSIRADQRFEISFRGLILFVMYWVEQPRIRGNASSRSADTQVSHCG